MTNDERRTKNGWTLQEGLRDFGGVKFMPDRIRNDQNHIITPAQIFERLLELEAAWEEGD